MPQPIYAALGMKVRARRDEMGMTQADLSARIGLSRASVANIENGRQAVLLHQFLSLASALCLQPNDLLPSVSSVSDRANLPSKVQEFIETIEQSAPASPPSQ